MSADCPQNGFAERSQPDYPIVVAEWPRNNHEILRVGLDFFNNRRIIDVRCWWRDSEGNRRPGRSGITLSIQHLERLADGLALALQQARDLGLIEVTPEVTPEVTQGVTPAALRKRRQRERQRMGGSR